WSSLINPLAKPPSGTLTIICLWAAFLVQPCRLAGFWAGRGSTATFYFGLPFLASPVGAKVRVTPNFAENGTDCRLFHLRLIFVSDANHQQRCHAEFLLRLRLSAGVPAEPKTGAYP